MQVAAAPSKDYAENLKQINANINIITQNANGALPAEDMHLIIAANVLSNQSYAILKNLSAALNPNGFILLEETIVQSEKLEVPLREVNLLLVGKQIDPLGKNYVLLKKRIKKEEPTVIHIMEKDMSWLKDVKAALKRSCEDNQEMLLVSQGEEFSGKIVEDQL